MRAIVVVMDSVGIGSAPDASAYGDEGADTVGHIAEACAAGAADSALREGRLNIPNLVGLGLGEACRLATGRFVHGSQFATPRPIAFVKLRRTSRNSGWTGCIGAVRLPANCWSRLISAA